MNNAIRLVRQSGRELLKSTAQIGRNGGAYDMNLPHYQDQLYQIAAEQIAKYYPQQPCLQDPQLAWQQAEQGATVWLLELISAPVNMLRLQSDFVMSISVLEKQNCLCSALYQPLSDHLFSVLRGSGAQCDGHRVRVPQKALEPHLFGIYAPEAQKLQQQHLLQNFQHPKSTAWRISGCATVDLLKVGLGQLEGCYAFLSKAEHINAGATLFVKESGGFVRIITEKTHTVCLAARDRKILALLEQAL